MIRCMGIDPGLSSTGIAVIEAREQNPKLVYADIIKTHARESKPHRLAHIYGACSNYIKNYSTSVIAIEKLYFSKNISSALPVSESIGVIQLAAVHSGASIKIYAPNEIKKCIVGIGKASKDQVKQMASMILGVSMQEINLHTSDAIAVALTWFFSSGGRHD